MKKLMFVLVIASMLLAACGAKPAESTAPVEITYMMWGSPEELAVWQTIVTEFESQNPNIKVKVDVSDWDGYWEKLKVLYASNTPPDVFAMDGPLYPDWQSRGVLLNLQSYIDATPGALDGIYPAALENYKRADGYYGLPRDFQTIVMFYNKNMFDAAGVAYPTADWTYDDFRETAKKLTVDTDKDGNVDQWGFGSDLWDMELFWSEVIWAHGGEIINAERTKTLLGEPKAREAWQMISDIVNVDKSMPSPDAAAQYGYDLFSAGKVAMWPIGHWAVPEYLKLGFKWDVVPMPIGPAGQATSANSAGFVVAKDSKHPEEAFKFIEFALSPTGQTRLTELGFAIPVRQSVAESPVFLNQKSVQINQQVFLDSIKFAHVKPAFKGYDQWAGIFGDGLLPVWNGTADINATLDTLVPQGDEVLAKNK